MASRLGSGTLGPGGTAPGRPARSGAPRRGRAGAGCGLFLAVLLAAAPPLVGPASANPLSKPEVLKLLKRNVEDSRLVAVVRELGINFKLSAEVVDELRAVGASPTLIAALQALTGGRDTAAMLAPAATAQAAPASPPAVLAPATSPPAAPVSPPPAPVAEAAAPPDPPVVVAPPPSAPSVPSPAAAAPPVPAPTAPAQEETEDGPPGHPLEPPPAAALPKGAAEAMAALIPGPPPPPPPPVITAPLRPPAAAEAALPSAAVPEAVAPRPAPAPAAEAAPRAAPVPEAVAPRPAPSAPAPEPPNRWEVVGPLLEKAESLHADGDVRGAQMLVARAMEIDPGEPKVWKAFKSIEQDLLARAETFLADGQLQRAFREFQFVVTTNPESALGYNGVGLALLQLKNYDEAVAAFEKALTLDPPNARYRQALTRARSLQRASRALERQGQQNLKEMIEEPSGRKKGP